MKVALQSADAVRALRLRFIHAMDDYSKVQPAWSVEQRDAFCKHMLAIGDDAFAVLRQNIQINGKDWDDYDEAIDAIEPIDKKLEESLLALQVEVNELLVEVAQCRNDVPVWVATDMAAQMQESAVKLDPKFEDEENRDPLPQNLTQEEREKLFENMHNTAALISQLSKALPETVSRLQQIDTR